VRLNGRVFEAVAARAARRPACDLYHSALEVRVAAGRFVIEQAPVRDNRGEQRGVVAEGSVGTHWAGRFRLFRYGPELELPGGSFAAGELVVIKRNDSQHGVTNGDRGQGTHVDPHHQRLTVRIDDREIELGPGFLHDTTSRGDPTLQHGYALTCHVAQGLTVDSAFLLADSGLTKELAYTALSRGRKSNQLYLTQHPDQPNAEFAPVEPARDPLVDTGLS
jgi:ATP-dependent exoDNAse (exonuclease V) alpha subunit